MFLCAAFLYSICTAFLYSLIMTVLQDDIIVPFLHLTVLLCLAILMMLFVKKTIVILFVKLFRKRPEWRYIWEPIREKDELLVQIPTYNEKEVYQLSIEAACGLSWTSDRIVIQVLDDSTGSVIKERVQVMKDEKVNEKNQEEEREGGSKVEGTKHENIRDRKGKQKVMEDEKEDERNQEEEREVKTTEEKGKRKRGGDMLEERKSREKRRKEGPVDEKKPGRQRKKKEECCGVRSCAAAIAGFITSALILVALVNIRYVEREETVYLFPT